MKYFSIVFLIFSIFYMACEKTEQSQECLDNPLEIISLTAQHDTIEAGGSTLVTAVAEGYKISYSWSASQGFLLPQEKENEVMYSASPCSIGEIIITCKVTDDCENSKTKEIKIFVL